MYCKHSFNIETIVTSTESLWITTSTGTTIKYYDYKPS